MGFVSLNSVILAVFIWYYRSKTKDSIRTDAGTYSDLARLLGLAIISSEISRLIWKFFPRKSRDLALKDDQVDSKIVVKEQGVVEVEEALGKVFVPELFVLDLDGTLLNDNAQISAESQEYLKQYLAIGGTILFATGQPLRAAQRSLSSMALDKSSNLYCICAGGGIVASFNSETGDILVDRKYEMNKIETGYILGSIFNSKSSKGLHIAVETEEKLLLSSDKFLAIVEEGIPGITKKVEKIAKVMSYQPGEEAKFANVLESFEELTGSLRLLIVHDTLLYKELITVLTPFVNEANEHFNQGKKFSLSPAGMGRGVEIALANVNKGTAVQDFVERFGFDRRRIVAFGDNLNDIEMLKYAAVSVGMTKDAASKHDGNGSDSEKENIIQQSCTRMSEFSNNDSGVIREMKKILSKVDEKTLVKVNLQTKNKLMKKLVQERNKAEQNLKDLGQILEAGLSLEKMWLKKKL